MAEVMIPVQFSEDENRMIKAATSTKRSPSFFIRQAIQEKLEDLELYTLGEAAYKEWVAEGKPAYSVNDLDRMIRDGFPEDV